MHTFRLVRTCIVDTNKNPQKYVHIVDNYDKITYTCNILQKRKRIRDA